MKTICIVNFNIYSLINPSSKAAMGGAELDMFVLAQSLREEYKVKVITGDWGQEDIVTVDGIDIFKSFKLERKWINYIKAPFIFFRILKKVDADIYITTSASPEVGFLRFFTRIFSKKFIYRTAHDIDCNFEYIKNNLVKGFFYKYGLENADAIVVSVKKHENLLATFHKKTKEKVFFAPLGIGANKVSLKEVKKEYILWVARCEDWKQPEIFLELASKLPEFKFLMICPKQKHKLDFFEFVKKRAVSISNLTFFDYIPFRDIQPYFDGAKIFINTSISEGFTFTLIQSGLGMTPVIYLNVDPDSVIVGNDLGYFSNGNILLMEKQIKSLMQDEEMWGGKSKNIYNYVLREHSMKTIESFWSHVLMTGLYNEK